MGVNNEAYKSEIEAILRPAFLCAIGDGQIADEELQDLYDIQPALRQFLEAREGIKKYLETGDFEEAKKIYDGSDRPIQINAHDLVADMFGGVPTFLESLYEEARGASDKEELFAIFEVEAAQITDPFLQELALLAMNWVASKDGDFARGERMVYNHFENELWKLDPQRPDFIRAAVSVERGEEISEPAGSDEEVLAELLEMVSDSIPEETDRDDYPPIFDELFVEGDWDKVREAAERGEDVNSVINFQGLVGLPILTFCADIGDLDALKALIKTGADVNKQLKNIEMASGYQDALTASLKSDNMDHFSFLIESGANPDPYKDSQSGWTPLTMAAKHENNKALKRLLKLGVDVDVANYAGESAFKVLSTLDDSSKNRKCLRTLIKANADVTRCDNEGYAAIHNFAVDCSIETMKVLIEEALIPIDLPKGRPEEEVGFSTPLLCALAMGNNEAATYLHEKGASLTIGKTGSNIFAAIIQGASEFSMTKELESPIHWLKLALAAGANPTFMDAIELIKRLDRSDDDYGSVLSWAPEFIDEILEKGQFPETVLKEIDEAEFSRMLELALSECPLTTGKVLEKFKHHGFDLGTAIKERTEEEYKQKLQSAALTEKLNCPDCGNLFTVKTLRSWNGVCGRCFKKSGAVMEPKNSANQRASKGIRPKASKKPGFLNLIKVSAIFVSVIFFVLLLVPGSHTVEPGESLSGIAERYNMSVSELQAHNDLGSDIIRSGEVLVIPSAIEIWVSRFF